VSATIQNPARDGRDESGYQDRFAARHAVFDEAFRRMVHALPVAEGDFVLDLGSGDGYFLNHFLSHPEKLHVAGLDPDPGCAKQTQSIRGCSAMRAVAENIPVCAESVDLVWSAHSMQSYAGVGAALREIFRVLKPGGTAAILENDCLHARILPIPPGLEIALFKQEIEESHDRAMMGLFYSRWSDRALDDAGFTHLSRSTYALERQSPWNQPAQTFYELLLEDALVRARHYLDGPLRQEAEDLLNPASTNYLGQRERRFFSEFHTLFVAQKPP
jgi:ubiquinone/menaquinone biosynthesis C-methylase UbiE